MNRLSIFLFCLLCVTNTNIMFTMNTPRANSPVPSYSTEDIINIIQNIDAQREKLNAYILSNNHSDKSIQWAQHQDLKQWSHKLEIQVEQLEDIVASHTALYGTHELEKAYIEYKNNKQCNARSN